MPSFVSVFEVFITLLDLAGLGLFIYIWVRIIRRRGETLARWGWMKRFLVLAFFFLATIVFLFASVWGVQLLFD